MHLLGNEVFLSHIYQYGNWGPAINVLQWSMAKPETEAKILLQEEFVHQINRCLHICFIPA